MLDDLFGNEDQAETPESAQASQKPSYYKSNQIPLSREFSETRPPGLGPRFAADSPPALQLCRPKKSVSSTRNNPRVFRGATCYLNSLFQALYMNHLFRSAFYSLPLCDENTNEKRQFGKNKRASNLLFEIQRLLVMLQAADTRAWETTDLTKSFGWQQNQGGD